LGPTVAIFRKRLLPYSETFIADQGRMLTRYAALYCGFQQDPSGIRLIENSDRYLLDDYSKLPWLSKFLFRSGPGGANRWVNAIAERSPSLIHAHFFNDGLDALRLGQRLKLPLVTTVHGHDITKHENAAGGNLVTAKFFERVDRVIAVSRFIARQALDRGCPEHKLVQHYIGIDLEKFSQPKQESRQPSLLFVGRLVEKKGCTYILQAMQKLKQKFPELCLTVVGEGILRPSLEQEAASRGLRVDFVGSETAAGIRQRLASSWLFVAPSITAEDGDAEGLGMVFLEAQAMQTPVVSFRSGGLVEAVEEDVTALLCREKDVDGLTDNIERLLENSTLRQNMGSAGRRRVETRFDIRKQCSRLELIYDEIT